MCFETFRVERAAERCFPASIKPGPLISEGFFSLSILIGLRRSNAHERRCRIRSGRFCANDKALLETHSGNMANDPRPRFCRKTNQYPTRELTHEAFCRELFRNDRFSFVHRLCTSFRGEVLHGLILSLVLVCEVASFFGLVGSEFSNGLW